MKNFLSRIKGFFHKWRLIRWGIYLSIALILFLCRYSILRGIGNWLIHEDTLVTADAIVVLGGGSEERSIKAVELMKKKYAPCIITTGSNISTTLKAVGLLYSEARITKTALKNKGIADSLILVMDEGTSTIEEATSLKIFAKKKKYKKLIVVTSKFHTARVHKYFNREFDNSGVKLIVQGAEPLQYKTSEWWKEEEGLMMVNNEYVKSFYYWWTK